MFSTINIEQPGNEMRRIEIVLRELERLSQAVTLDDLARGSNAFTAEQIGFNLGLARNSVSKDLNQLWSDGLVIKTRGRPVFFLHRRTTETLLDRTLTESEREPATLADLLPQPQDNNEAVDPFAMLIGHDRSLHDAVEKGKAAVLYPHGLHVLLTGPSGVGKTFFAELMHRYACEHAGEKRPPLVYFNCAEYANNPELLSSHLFGHRQGAFTGATENKSGLIEQADGGYLLLDEVHRLPYEGQEKLFSLLDKGEYRPLGASGPARNIAVRLICATTEPISSSLLRTFQRRIQVTIDLPGIRQRSVEEQIELIIGFLQRESRKIERTVSIDKTLLLWLLNKPLEGNIGQLKSDIQFLCAQAWASGMAAHNEVLLLDSKLADGPINATPEQRQLVDALFNGRPLLNIDARTLPQLKSSEADDSVEESDLFYSFLTREYVNLRNSNVPPAETLAILKNKLSSIFEYGLYSRDNASHAPRYGDRIEERVDLLIGYVEQVLGFALPENLVNPLRKHFLALISYVQRGLIPQLYSSSLILDRCKDEYDNATLLCKKINDLLHIQCPATEVVWLCLFLKECRHYRQRINASPDCGAILIAHGATTATSMAQYVNRVLERELFNAIDMPFEQSVHDTLEKLIQLIHSKGWQRLILMVDIGSLVHFGSTISKLFQIDVLLMPNITLTSLLEIGLDLSYETGDLPRLVNLMQEKGIASQLCTPQQENAGKVLVISCITGMGTAEKIKKVLEESFGELMSQDTRMVILDYNEVRSPERLQQAIRAHERLAGIVGTFQPGLPDIPFISLEELFSEQGPELVLSLLTPDLSSSERRLEMERSASRFISALTMESIINHISVLNPQRILKEMEGILNQLRNTLAIAPNRQVTLRFLIHCCCMVERIVINRKPLQMALETRPDMDAQAFSVIKSAFHPVEEAYAIRLSDAEYIYIYELLFS